MLIENNILFFLQIACGSRAFCKIYGKWLKENKIPREAESLIAKHIMQKKWQYSITVTSSKGNIVFS